MFRQARVVKLNRSGTKKKEFLFVRALTFPWPGLALVFGDSHQLLSAARVIFAAQATIFLLLVGKNSFPASSPRSGMEPVLSGFQLAPGQSCSDTWSKGRVNWKDLCLWLLLRNIVQDIGPVYST